MTLVSCDCDNEAPYLKLQVELEFLELVDVPALAGPAGAEPIGLNLEPVLALFLVVLHILQSPHEHVPAEVPHRNESGQFLLQPSHPQLAVTGASLPTRLRGSYIATHPHLHCE
jgi:hypothetical protein